MEKPIKKSVINTFNRVGIPYEQYLTKTEKEKVENQFGFGSCETSCLVARCILWVYETSYQYERGNYEVLTSDFDRIRYFVLDEDRRAYMTCLD